MKRYYILLIFLGFISCDKQLDQKSNKSQFQLRTVADVQSMIDYFPYTGYDAGADEGSADNYFSTDATYNAFSPEDQRTYTWGNAFLFTKTGDWEKSYGKIYYSNVAMEKLIEIGKTEANPSEWNNVYGQAIFKRAHALWRLTNVFTLPYDAATADTDMGLPIRLSSNFELKAVRSTLTETYSRIISDLEESIPLLNINPPHPARPSRPAAYGILSSIYLSMRDYPKAKIYADSALALHPQLLDYNTVNASPSVRYSFQTNNVESIFMSIADSGPLFITTSRIDTTLYASYSNTDLRKKLFFRSRPDGYYSFKGSYANSEGFSCGIAADELYLIRAECYARAGQVQDALADLNHLMETRFVTGTFVPFAAGNAADALALILVERRKELVYRFSRWSDIRRLNKEGANIILKRVVNGQTYQLLPNSPKYARPIPENIIAVNGIPQNPQD